MLVSGKSSSCRLANFLEMYSFGKFDHVSRNYNWIKFRIVWFAKVIIIFIKTTQVYIFDMLLEKETHLNAVEIEYTDHLQKFNEISLPEREHFYSQLKM